MKLYRTVFGTIVVLLLSLIGIFWLWGILAPMVSSNNGAEVAVGLTGFIVLLAAIITGIVAGVKCIFERCNEA